MQPNSTFTYKKFRYASKMNKNLRRTSSLFEYKLQNCRLHEHLV